MKDNKTSQIYLSNLQSPSFRGTWLMELALLIFRGSLDFKVELNRLRTTVKKMQLIRSGSEAKLLKIMINRRQRAGKKRGQE
jgi:hypothetical protein